MGYTKAASAEIERGGCGRRALRVWGGLKVISSQPKMWAWMDPWAGEATEKTDEGLGHNCITTSFRIHGGKEGKNGQRGKREHSQEKALA